MTPPGAPSGMSCNWMASAKSTSSSTSTSWSWSPGRGWGMTEFNVGNRVRVRDLPRTEPNASRTGTVLWVGRNAAEVAVLYQVQLDGTHPAYAVFSPHELRPEASETP